MRNVLVESVGVGPAPFCVRCRYDLRATPPDGVCPECGAPCEWSTWLGTADGERWRRYVRLGMLLLCSAVVAGTIISISWDQLSLRFGWYRVYWLHWTLQTLVPLGLVLAGSLGATMPPPADLNWERRMSVRRAARVLVIIGAGGLIASPFLQMLLDQLALDYWFYHRTTAEAVVKFIQEWHGDAFASAMWFGAWMLAMHLVAVAGVFRNTGILWHAKRAFIGLVALKTLSAACDPALGAALGALRPLIGDTGFYMIVDSSPLRLFSIGLWLGGPVLSAWAAVVLWHMARSLKRPV